MVSFKECQRERASRQIVRMGWVNQCSACSSTMKWDFILLYFIYFIENRDVAVSTDWLRQATTDISMYGKHWSMMRPHGLLMHSLSSRSVCKEEVIIWSYSVLLSSDLTFRSKLTVLNLVNSRSGPLPLLICINSALDVCDAIFFCR